MSGWRRGGAPARSAVAERLGREDLMLQPLERLEHRRDCRLGDLVAVEAALARRPHREAGLGPHIARVHLGVGLQYCHAPLAFAPQDRPVERRRPAVALDARMHHEAEMVTPHGFRDGAPEIGRDDHVRLVEPRRLDRHGVVDVELDRDLVPALGELGVETLGEAVEAVGEKKDAHD